MKRRRFLKAIISGSFLALSSFGLWNFQQRFKWPVGSLKTSEIELLAGYLDVLIPPDDTAGAADLQVHIDIAKKAEGEREYRRVIKRGCRWLEREAAKTENTNFLALDENQRILVVARSAEAAPGSIENVFFEQLRSDGFHYYYAHPEIWPSIGFQGPPQPMGYLDYRFPPMAHLHS